MKAEKKAVRDRIRRRLAEMTDAERNSWSEQIASRLTALPGWRAARSVMAFLSLPTEVQTRSIIDRAWGREKRVLVPRVDWEHRRMSAVELNSWSDPLVTGRLGLVEPAATTAGADAGSIDLVLVPGLAFDSGGGRLGRGGGFFDRFLAQPGFGGLTCGLAFDCQRVDRLPREATDLGVDLRVTESAVVAFTARGRRGAGEG